jgi:hypothetical protein
MRQARGVPRLPDTGPTGHRCNFRRSFRLNRLRHSGRGCNSRRLCCPGSGLAWWARICLGSTGARPNADHSLQVRAARFGLIDRPTDASADLVRGSVRSDLCRPRLVSVRSYGAFGRDDSSAERAGGPRAALVRRELRAKAGGANRQAGRRAEGGGRRTEDGGRRAEGGGRRTEGGGRRTEGGGRPGTWVNIANGVD